jgi:hypothetical protein
LDSTFFQCLASHTPFWSHPSPHPDNGQLVLVIQEVWDGPGVVEWDTIATVAKVIDTTPPPLDALWRWSQDQTALCRIQPWAMPHRAVATGEAGITIFTTASGCRLCIDVNVTVFCDPHPLVFRILTLLLIGDRTPVTWSCRRSKAEKK